MAQKPSIPKGTRDFTPAEMVKRDYIFDTIKSVFKLYGYQPIETPAMENLSTLLGKYGDEGDKLLFKILNSGDFAEKIPGSKIQSPNSIELTGFISEKGLRYDLTVPFARFVVQNRNEINFLSDTIVEKGLRYDLTVPFARFVVQNRNEITFPFKRYQIQPVWRADKPQKGRYREFFQCDVDVIGSNSLLNEVELVQIIDDVFKRLKVNVTIKLNNRKVLYGIAEYIGETEKFMSITIAIDKLDKLGIEGVKRELSANNISDTGISKLEEMLDFKGSTVEKLNFLAEKLRGTETGQKGIEEMQTVFSTLDNMDVTSVVELDLTLARGLNYYTGAIFEVASNEVKIGSICGGGRYDDLTGIFGLPDVSGVGVSFGADRIYDVMTELNLFPLDTGSTTQVFFVNFGEKEQQYCLGLLEQLRRKGINAELYPDKAKMKKQMSYANSKNIPFVVLIGENEMNAGTLTVKNMETGEQASFESIRNLIEKIKG